MEKNTVGQQIFDIIHKEQLDEATPNELGKEMLGSFEQAMLSWIEQGKKAYPGDFYVVVNLKLEQSLNYTPHMIPELRQSCPTPFYDQSVWKYHRKDDRLEFIWTIPDLQACLNLKLNAHKLPDDQKELLGYVLDYSDGTLLTKAKTLNGEIVI
jgi:hypothetical protein